MLTGKKWRIARAKVGRLKGEIKLLNFNLL